MFTRFFGSKKSNNAKSQTPKTRKLRMESLENRELLSVTPTEYHELRNVNPELYLPADPSEINIIDLTELTSEALQKAADLAATTPQDDLIYVRTAQDASTLDLTGVTVSIDADNFGSLTIAASKDCPVNLSVKNLDGSALTIESGVVVLANANFVDVDATDLETYANLISVADGATYKPVHISVFNADGVDVSALDVRETLANERSEARYEFAASQEGDGVDAATSANDYAILFYGGCDSLQNHDRYYYNLKELYEVLTVSYDLPRENIFILYAGGVDQNTYITLGPDRNDPAANGLYSDLSFAKGSPVYSANSGNLYDACATVSAKMTDDSHLLFFTYDHGSGEEGDATNYNDYLCGWNENVGGSFVADALFQIDRGFVTTVHSQCYSGGILDDIQNPATGAVLDADNGATWYGMAAANHYEVSSSAPVQYHPVTGAFISGGGFASKFVEAIDPAIVGYSKTTDVFAYSKANTQATANETYDNNAGTYTKGKQHPWAVGENFNIFSKTFTATSKADLLVESYSRSGTTVTISVKNEGAAYASGFAVKFELYNEQTGALINQWEQTITSSVAPGGYATVKQSLGSLATLKYALVMTVDSKGVVNESDETNNMHTRYISYNGATLPDVDLSYYYYGDFRPLFVSYLAGEGEDSYETWKEPTSNDYLFVNYGVVNYGYADAGAFKVNFTLTRPNGSTASLGEVEYSGLAARTMDDDWLSLGALSAGTYTITMTVDSAKAVSEYDESNNVYSTTFTVHSPTPDLRPYKTVDALVISTELNDTTYDSTATFTDQDVIHATALYANYSSDYAVSGSYKARLVLRDESGSVVKTLNFNKSSLAAFTASRIATTSANNFGKLAAGYYTLSLILDPDGVVAEMDETNNVFTRSFYVKATSTQLSAPSLSVSAKSSSELSVTIGNVSNASSYTLEYSTSSSFTSSTTSTKTYSSSGTYTLSGLSANTTYYVRVKAIGNGTTYSDSSWSSVKSATTPKIELSTPSLSVSAKSSSELSVTIGSVSNASSYTLEYSTSSSFTSSTTATKTYSSSGTYTLSGLSANTTYYVRVKAVGTGSYSDSSWSSVKNATTAKIALSTPSLSVSATSSSTIKATIGSVSNASSYTLEYSTSSSFTSSTTVTKTGLSSGAYTLTGLSANTTYYVRVKAVGTGSYSDSSWSSVKSVTTPNPDPTQLSAPSLSVSAKSSSSLSVTIGSVSNASSYTLEYSTSSSFTSKTTKTYSSSGTYTLTGLSANTKYYVRVKAIGDGTTYSDSAWSSVKNATTPNPETPSLVVTTNSDVVNDADGLISLREAIAYAEADSSLGSKITFATSLKGKTITLSGTQLEITKGITIDASALYTASTNTPGLTLDANQKSRVFYVTGGTASNPVAFVGLKITGGKTSDDGGGVYVSSGSATFTNSTISGNTASINGGGVGVFSGSATFTNSTISGNTATKFSSGGVYVTSSGSATFTNSTISGNRASTAGGGVGVFYSGSATFTNSTISGNTASYGSGGGVNVNYYGSATFTNSTISGNTASSYGGGVCVYSSSCSATLYNSIVALNAASSSGADVYDDGTVKAYNTLSSYTAWDAGSSNYTYSSSSPLFTNAANGDYTLAANSQAINKGNNSYISGYTTDLAGKTRVVGGTVDLGAYEYQQATTQLSAPSLSVSAKSSSSLSVTIGNVSNASSYTLEYSTSSSFTSSTTTTKTYSSSGTYTLSGLSANTKYYVRVKAEGTGSYSDSAWSSVKNATTPADVGDTISTAATLTFSGVVATATEEIGNGQYGDQDVDVYKVYLTAGVEYTLQTAKPSGGTSFDSYLRLANASGTVLLGQDDGNGLYSKATFTPTSSGYYYVGVSGYSNYNYSFTSTTGRSSGQVGDYTLTITAKATEITSVALKGTAQVGKTLTATVSPSGATATYQWYRVDASNVATAISGATASTYQPTNADIGYNIRVIATGYGAYTGSASAKTSAKVKAPLTSVSISGTAQVGKTLTATVAPNGATATYQWYYGSSATSVTTKISGATSATFTLTDAYVGKYIKVVATGSGNYVDSVSKTVGPVDKGGEAPAAPTNVTFTQTKLTTSGGTAVNVKWTDVATDETGYRIEAREAGASAWTLAGTTKADKQVFAYNDFTPGVEYEYRVRAENGSGASAWATGTFTALTAPDAKVARYDASAGTATLTLETTPLAKQMRVEIATSPFTTEAQLSSSKLFYSVTLKSTASSLTVKNLEAGTTYYCRVRAINDAGVSDWCDAVSMKIGSTPAAPTNVTFTQTKLASSGGTTVNVKWTDVATNETGYRVEVRESGASDWTPAGSTKANKELLAFTDFTPGVEYDYRVRAENASGASAWATGSFTALTAPETKVAHSDASGKTATLSFAPTPLTTQMRVEVSTTPFATEATISSSKLFYCVTLKANATTTTVKNLEAGKTYYVRVRAINDAGVSDWSDTLQLKLGSAPAAPKNVTFSQTKLTSSSGTSVNVKWTDVATDETGYRIDVREVGTSDWTCAGTTKADKQVFTYNDFIPGVAYEYRVRAENASGASAWATGSFTALAAPEAKVARSDASAGTATLSLATTALTEQMRVEVSTTPFATEATISSSKLFYSVTLKSTASSVMVKKLEAGTTYYVRVRAINAAGVSAWSDTLQLKLGSAPAAPTNVTFTQTKLASAGGTAVNVKWTDVATDETGYRVEVREAGTSSWTHAGKTSANKQVFTYNDFTPGVEYEWRVRAENAFGVSSWATGAFTALTAPKAKVARYDASAGTGTLTLATSALATQTRVEVSTSPFTTEATVSSSNLFYCATLKSTASSLTIKKLDAGTTYYVRVRAINDAGVSDWCDTLTLQLPTSNASTDAVSEAFADFFAEDGGEDDFWFEFEKAAGKRR